MAVKRGVMVTDLVTVTGDTSCKLGETIPVPLVEVVIKPVPLEVVIMVPFELEDTVTGLSWPVTETMGFKSIKVCEGSIGERSPNLSSERDS